MKNQVEMSKKDNSMLEDVIYEKDQEIQEKVKENETLIIDKQTMILEKDA